MQASLPLFLASPCLAIDTLTFHVSHHAVEWTAYWLSCLCMMLGLEHAYSCDCRVLASLRHPKELMEGSKSWGNRRIERRTSATRRQNHTTRPIAHVRGGASRGLMKTCQFWRVYMSEKQTILLHTLPSLEFVFFPPTCKLPVAVRHATGLQPFAIFQLQTRGYACRIRRHVHTFLLTQHNQ